MERSLNINWDVLYIGLEKGWLGPGQALEHVITSELINEVTPEELGNLFVHEDDKLFMNEFFKSKLTSDYDERQVLDKWAFYYLQAIYDSNESITKKLEDIAKIWAMFDYPKDWEKFIYYLPITDKGSGSPENVYENFKSFMNAK